MHVLPRDRETYIEALEAGDGRDLEPLEAFLLVKMARSLLRLLDMVGMRRTP